MGVKTHINAEDRMYLPTIELYETTGKFGSIVPAFNNNYDVYVNFEPSALRGYIKEKALFDMSGDPGQMLALLCSEAVLPGSQMQFSEVDGLRQGVQQSFALYRRYPEVILTWYSQKDYYTNDVFNSWLDFISPPVDLGKKPTFRKMNYPDEYKCAIEITAFSKDTTDDTERLLTSNQFRQQTPSSITYYLERAFPVSIVAAPLAYGRAELVKTTITFKYDYFYTRRNSRVGPILNEGDIMMPPRVGASEGEIPSDDRLQERLSINDNPAIPPIKKEGKGFQFPEVGLGIHHWSGSSDIRLKENIVKVGRSPSGLNIYEWNYIWGSPRYSGVMAQEIINIIPEAVVTMPNGYLGVNYAKIDVDMLTK